MGHGQAEFNKQKHMCPAVPLAFPSSRVWLANLSSAALGPGVSTFDLYRSKKLLTSGEPGRLRGALLHLLLALLEGGRRWGTKCVTAHSLWSAGQRGRSRGFPLLSRSASAVRCLLKGFGGICSNSISLKGMPAEERMRWHHPSSVSCPGCDKRFCILPVATLLKALRNRVLTPHIIAQSIHTEICNVHRIVVEMVSRTKYHG